MKSQIQCAVRIAQRLATRLATREQLRQRSLVDETRSDALVRGAPALHEILGARLAAEDDLVPLVAQSYGEPEAAVVLRCDHELRRVYFGAASVFGATQ